MAVCKTSQRGFAGFTMMLLSLFVGFATLVAADKAAVAATRYQLHVYSSPNFEGNALQIRPNACSKPMRQKGKKNTKAADMS